MARLSKKKLQEVLNTRLSLKDPNYFLERSGDRWVGSVVSATFNGKDDLRRQEMIWDAFDAEFGNGWARFIGMLLAYTPDEWKLGREDSPSIGKRKKVG